MNIVSAFTRLCIRSTLNPPQYAKNISTNSTLLFRATPCLMAEPLKKKKRLDPAIIKAREERKKKKLEKQIRRLERNARQKKPIEECEIPLVLIEQEKIRQRPAPKLTAQIVEQRTLLQKQWAKYKHEEHLKDLQLIDRIMFSQQRALDELRKESEELYLEAIQIDPTLLPYKSEGPVDTPPIENYNVPDGEYQDVSRKWE